MTIVKRILLGVLLLLFSAVIFCLIVVQIEVGKTSYLEVSKNPSLGNNSYLIKNVNVVPMTSDTVLKQMNVLVANGVIQRIGREPVPEQAKVIDAGGAYLSPGLADMHMHLWDRFELGLYLANGVTTVRNLLGMPFHLSVKKEIASGDIIGPMFSTASPQLSGPYDEDPLKKPVESREDVKKLVRQYKEAGYDYIKTYNLLPQHLFDAVLEESTACGIPVVAHPSFEVDYAYHFHPAISTVEHTEDIYQQPLNYTFDSNKLKAVVAGYAASNQTHCPTLTVFYNLTEIYNKGEAVQTSEQAAYINRFVKNASDDYSRHMAIRKKDNTATGRMNKQHRFHIEIVRKLHKAGVPIVSGTDAGIVNTAPGFSLHQELAFYTQAGMSNYEALQTATVNPAKMHDDYGAFGTIEKGKLANFILSSENPLADLSTLQYPVWVMVKGRLLDRSQLTMFQENAKNRNNELATMIRVFKYIYWDK